MIEIAFGEKFYQPVVLALGFFDSIHRGHKYIIGKAVDEAKIHNRIPAVMTFKNNPYNLLSGGVKLVYTYNERLMLLNGLGVEAVLCAEFNERFKNTEADDFLRILAENMDIKCIICGYDFKYGKNGNGNTDTLTDFCKSKSIKLFVIDEQKFGGNRLASTAVRESIKTGDVKAANALLGGNYFITGTVKRGRNVGSKLLYPTVNIETDKDKLPLKEGVYATMTDIDGAMYKSVTNCGAKPTFNESGYDVETHIIGYNGDLYNRTVTVYFFDRLRDIIKFDSVNQLKECIGKDIERAEEILK